MGAISLRDDRIVWLDGGVVSRELVGGKGASLSRLLALGAPVPPAIGFTTHAYRDFAGHLDLGRRFADVEHGLHDSLRDLILHAPLPSFVEALMRRGWSEIRDRIGPESRLAVRSSAIDEDSAEHSFAGLHDTILGVTREEEFVAAVRQCWASLWSDRAIAYRRTDGLNGDPAIAVIAQQMVNCDVSFVAFSADPITGREDQVVINAAWGLGESIVSGTVTPDYVVVGAADQILAYTIGDKERMTIADQSGSRDVQVPRLMRHLPAISDETAVRIARTVRDLADRFGHPTDIEGGLVGDCLHVFQARPITTGQRPAA
jgi:phosphoenolpyruvate synthase/pyruvate phosphate dikinase